MKRFLLIPLFFFPMVMVAKVYADNTPTPDGNIHINMNAPSNLLVTNFGVLLSGAIGLILVISALACFFFLIYGGISWITSGGDKSGVETAQKRIQAAVIGLFVVFAAWALMTIVGGFFGFNIANLIFPTGYKATPTPIPYPWP